MLQLYLVMGKSHPGGTGFEGHEEQLRPGTVRGHGRPLSEGAASVEIDSPGLKGTCSVLEMPVP